MKILKNSFIILLTGSSLAGILNIIFYPLISRLYSVEDFGILATLTSITAFLCIFSTGKYEQAVIIAKNEKEAVTLILLSISLCGFLSLVCLIISQTYLANHVARLFHTDKLIKFLWLCPFAVLGISAYNCYNEWCVRKKTYGALSFNRCFNSIAVTGSRIFCYLIPNGLVIGDTAGHFISGGQSFLHFFSTAKEYFGKKKISLDYFKKTAYRYIKFPKFILADQTINYFSGNLPIFFISSYFGIKTLGSYSMATSILAIPSAFFEKAFIDMFRSRACEEYNQSQKCYSVFHSFFFRMLVPAILISILAFPLIPKLFPIFLGGEWGDAGKIAQILFPAVIFRFFFMTFSPVWIITKKLNHRLYWQITFTLLNLLALIIGCIFFNSIKCTLILLLAARVIAYSLGIINVYILSNRKRIDLV